MNEEKGTPKLTRRFQLLNWVARLLRLEPNVWTIPRMGWNRTLQQPVLALVNPKTDEVVNLTMLDDHVLAQLTIDMRTAIGYMKMARGK